MEKIVVNDRYLIFAVFPFEYITFKSKVDTDLILNSISNNLVENMIFSKREIRNSGKPYIGNLRNNKFKMFRNIKYRNSFLPIISGTISQEINGTKIRVTMRPPIFSILIFLFILYISISQFFNNFFLQKNIGSGMSLQEVLVTLSFPIFIYVLCMIGFKSEALKSKDFIESLLEKMYNNNCT